MHWIWLSTITTMLLGNDIHVCILDIQASVHNYKLPLYLHMYAIPSYYWIVYTGKASRFTVLAKFVTFVLYDMYAFINLFSSGKHYNWDNIAQMMYILRIIVGLLSHLYSQLINNKITQFWSDMCTPYSSSFILRDAQSLCVEYIILHRWFSTEKETMHLWNSFGCFFN